MSGFRAALDLNTYPLRNLIRPRCAERAKPGRGKPVLIMHWLFSLFSRHVSRTQSFQQNRHVTFPALVALKLLISLMSRLVACSPRFRPDRQTHRQTDRQNDYCNPRCACAPRVNNYYDYYINYRLCNVYICTFSRVTLKLIEVLQYWGLSL